MTRILVTAESFGYGPIITCLNITRRLRERLKGHYIFLGSRASLEQAACSALFEEYRECDTFSRRCLQDCKDLFLEANFLLSVENIEGAVLGVQLGKKVFFVDNLFWMWNDFPEELCRVDTYFMAESLDLSENLARMGEKIRKKLIIGPLRDYFGGTGKDEIENRILINFGGAESFMIDQGIILRFYRTLLGLIIAKLDGRHTGQIIVCGGRRLMRSLGAYFGENSGVTFRSFQNREYLETLCRSRYVIMSPGLGNFFEALSLDHEVLFVPPINYSQYWQLEAYRELRIGFRSHNWNDFPWFMPIEKYAREEDGVNQVLANVDLFLRHKASQDRLAGHIGSYLNGAGEHYGEARREYFLSYKKDGAGSIVDEIIRRSGSR